MAEPALVAASELPPIEPVTQTVTEPVSEPVTKHEETSAIQRLPPILPLRAALLPPTQTLVRQERAWRTEVKNGGKYWGWRKGSNGDRKSKYGGKFEQLSAERKAAYYKNIKSKSRRHRDAG